MKVLIINQRKQHNNQGDGKSQVTYHKNVQSFKKEKKANKMQSAFFLVG